MKPALLFACVLAFGATSSHAQNSPIFRCSGNIYTNDPVEARAKGCKTLDGSNVTIIQGTRVNGSAPLRVATAPQTAGQGPGQRVDADDQRARDSDARSILEAELKKAESRQAELVREYNNGEPEMLGPEHRNQQKYLDRIAELKAGIARAESDIAGIRRELGRVASK